jgi:RHS repeat-associated protein
MKWASYIAQSDRVFTNAGTPNMPTVVLTNTYDAGDRRTQVTATVAGTADFQNTYTYDALDRMTQVRQVGQTGGNAVAAKRVDLTYNAAGNFASIVRYANAAGTQTVATTTYTYDALRRLTALDHKKGATNLAHYTWTYDAAGRLTATTNVDGSSSFHYDATGQLTSANHSYQANESYSYDANGNRTNAGYTTGTNNRLTSDGTYNYLYDDEGNRIRRTRISDGSYTTYTWDHRNRLTAVSFFTAAGLLTKKVAYTYDLFDRRIMKQVDDTGSGSYNRTEKYVYDFTSKSDGVTDVRMDDVVLTLDGSNAIRNRYLHGPAVDQVFADEDALAGVLWSASDELGTIRDWLKYDPATDATTVHNHLRYDGFGRITGQSNSGHAVVFAFTGREWDADTGLQYNRMRWYDPSVGRWISEDPAGFAAGDANLNRYVGNQVLYSVDPSGLIDGNGGGDTMAGHNHGGNYRPERDPEYEAARNSTKGLYWHYVINPSKMDADLRYLYQPFEGQANVSNMLP